MLKFRNQLILPAILISFFLAPVIKGQTTIVNSKYLDIATKKELQKLTTNYINAFVNGDKTTLDKLIPEQSSYSSLLYTSEEVTVYERFDDWLKVLAVTKEVRLQNIKIENITREPYKARIVVSFSLDIINAETNKPIASLAKMRRVLECIKGISQFNRDREKQSTPAHTEYFDETPKAGNLNSQNLGQKYNFSAETEWLVQKDFADSQFFAKTLMNANAANDTGELLIKSEPAASLSPVIDELIKIAAENFEKNDYSSGLSVLQTIKAIKKEQAAKFDRNQQEQIRTSSLNNIRTNTDRLKENQKILNQLQTVPDEQKTIEDKNYIAYLSFEIPDSLRSIANSFYQMKDFKSSIAYYNESLAQFEIINNKLMMASVLEEMGQIFYDQKDEETALSFWIKSCDYWEKGLMERKAIDKSNQSGGYYFRFEPDSQGRMRPKYTKGNFNISVNGFVLPDSFARLLNKIGETYQKRNEYDKALSYFKKSRDQYETILIDELESDSSKSADYLIGDGIVQEMLAEIKIYDQQGNEEKVWSAFENSVKEIKHFNRKKLFEDFYFGFMNLKSNIEDNNQYEIPDQERISRVLLYIKNQGQEKEEYFYYFLFIQSFNYFKQNENKEAEKLLNEAIDGIESLPNGSDTKDLLPWLYQFQGFISLQRGDNIQAVSNFKKMASLQKQVKNTDEGEGKLFDILSKLYIGVTYASQGYENIGLNLARQRLPLIESFKSAKDPADLIVNAGSYYLVQNNQKLAKEFYEKVLLTPAWTDEDSLHVEVLDQLADIYENEKNFDTSQELLLKELHLLNKIDKKNRYATVLQHSGEVYLKQKKYDEALKKFQEIISIDKKTKTPSSSNLLLNIAEAHFLKNEFDEALSFANAAYNQSKREGESDVLRSACNLLGKLYLKFNNYSQAYDFYDEGIKTIEFMRRHIVGGEQEKQFFFDDKLESYRAMIDLLARQNRNAEALSFAERSKARVLLDAMQFGKTNLITNLAPEERKKNDGILERLTNINIKLKKEEQKKSSDSKIDIEQIRNEQKKIRLEYSSYQAELFVAHQQQIELTDSAAAFQPGEATSRLIDDKTALLEFAVTEEKTYLFVFTKNAVEWRRYDIDKSADGLSHLIEEYRNIVTEPDANRRSNDYKKPAQDLYNILLSKAAAQLKGKTSLIIIPDAELWSLPFQALYANDHFLIEEAAISYVPSIAVLREIHIQKDKRSKNTDSNSSASKTGRMDLLSFGNPNFDPTLNKQTVNVNETALGRDRLEPLPSAEIEASEVAGFYRQSLPLIGNNATEEKFKLLAGNYKILHLATHGIVFDDNPLYSYIALAQPKENITKPFKEISPKTLQQKEDGSLEAREIMNMNLNADLVVLSACKTALGHISKGEGMIGLTWAFSLAGVPTTVASLWSVNSCSTTSLMIEFHRRLSESVKTNAKSLEADEALRQAVLTVIHNSKEQRLSHNYGKNFTCDLSADYSHPYYWAGFIVTGDSR